MKSNIIIYGAGEYGKRLYHFLQGIGVRVDYFCQTSCDADICYEDIKIIDIIYLSKMAGDIMVFIAVKDSMISESIKIQLLNLNRSDLHIYEFGDFISQNTFNVVEENEHYCNLCGRNIPEFGQAVFALSDVFKRHHVIGGGGVRENEVCPLCGCKERKRWQYWVLAKHTGIFSEKCSVLHIAPEPEISVRIQSNSLCDYYSGNIVPGAMLTVDVTDIQFRDDFFDYIIINHVLEHIQNEAKAVTELKRVLKPSGKIILSFPICTDMDTYENPDIQTPRGRLEAYGQEDHVRLYGKDYKERLEKFGLSIKDYVPQNECSQEEIVRYGFNYDDTILIATKSMH